jgi:hypothetical protein
MLSQLAAMPREQMIEFLQRLPSRSPGSATAGPRFHLIELPIRPPAQRR